jgi:LacI family transcriptional regulator
MTRVTINEIAALAGVSNKTVSRVINHSPLIAPDTRARVEQVIAEAGFVPDPQARALALRRNSLVLLVHDGSMDHALPAAQSAMLDALAGSNHALCVHRLDQQQRTLVSRFGDFLEHHRPSGVVLMPPVAAIDALAGMAWEFGCRTARLGARQDIADGWFASQDREGMARLVRRMVALGHRRIAFVSGAEGDIAAREREMGYLDALAEAGLDRGPALIANGDGGFASGLEAGRLLLEVSPPPTAIACASDGMAAGVLHAARALDFAVPQSLSVTGFGDSATAACLLPPLTTVLVPLSELARLATLRIIDPACEAIGAGLLPVEVVERETLAPPRAQSAATSASGFFQTG